MLSERQARPRARAYARQPAWRLNALKNHARNTVSVPRLSFLTFTAYRTQSIQGNIKSVLCPRNFIACGGLGSAPDRRTRRALLHLSYSCAPPCGPAILVTHYQNRSFVVPLKNDLQSSLRHCSLRIQFAEGGSGTSSPAFRRPSTISIRSARFLKGRLNMPSAKLGEILNTSAASRRASSSRPSNP